MDDQLNISEMRRAEIKQTIDLLMPVESLGSREIEVAVYNYCESLSPVERLFAIQCGSNRALKNAEDARRRTA